MFMRNALKPMLRYRFLSVSTSARNAAKSQKQQKCGNLLAIKLRQATPKFTPKESPSQPKSNFQNVLFLIRTASKGVAYLPNLVKDNRMLIQMSKVRSLRQTQVQYTEDQPPGTYKPESEGHEKILAEQQRQLEELKNKQKSKGVFQKLLSGDKPDFPKYKPRG